MKIISFGILFAAFILLTCSCFAQEITSLDLLNNTKKYDGNTVVYKGEVIGDIMKRRDYAWLHVNNNTVAIGIWAHGDLTRNISYTGDYRNRGDLVEVIGIFHRSCSEHGGDLDIHAQTITVVAPGSIGTQALSKKRLYLGIGSFFIVLLLDTLNKYFQRKEH